MRKSSYDARRVCFVINSLWKDGAKCQNDKKKSTTTTHAPTYITHSLSPRLSVCVKCCWRRTRVSLPALLNKHASRRRKLNANIFKSRCALKMINGPRRGGIHTLWMRARVNFFTGKKNHHVCMRLVRLMNKNAYTSEFPESRSLLHSKVLSTGANVSWMSCGF